MAESEDITHQAISACFIGPRAENLGEFRNSITALLDGLQLGREKYFADDGYDFIPSSIQTTAEFQRVTGRVSGAVRKLRRQLQETARLGVRLCRGPDGAAKRRHELVRHPLGQRRRLYHMLGDTFKKVVEEEVEEEVEVCRARNENTPDYHSFWTHGTDSVFLSYRSMFHIAKHRRQIILAVELDTLGSWVYAERQHRG